MPELPTNTLGSVGVYEAVIVCDPTASVEVTTLAFPAPSSAAGELICAAPSVNCTVPVGIVVPLAAVTVAVRVTG